VGVAFVPAPVFSLLPKISRPENLGLSFGILSMFASMGMLFGPYVTGLLKDKTGSYEVSFIFLSVFALLLTLTALVLRTKTRGD
jgi:MFS-type transporter involved in bile tolerance (Atg22 family)